jgi:hypothetical protein
LTTYSLTTNNGWTVITPDPPSGTPAQAINDNFNALATLVSSSGTVSGLNVPAPTLAAVLAESNATGGNNIVVPQGGFRIGDSGNHNMVEVLPNSGAVALVGQYNVLIDSQLRVNSSTVLDNVGANSITTDGNGNMNIGGTLYVNGAITGSGTASSSTITTPSGKTFTISYVNGVISSMTNTTNTWTFTYTDNTLTSWVVS